MFRYRFPPDGAGCLFGCEGVENVEGTVHPGLSPNLEYELISMLKKQRDEVCLKMVPKENICYDYNNLHAELEGEKKKAIQKIISIGKTTKDRIIWGGTMKDVEDWDKMAGETRDQFIQRQAEFRYTQSKGYLIRNCKGEGVRATVLSLDEEGRYLEEANRYDRLKTKSDKSFWDELHNNKVDYTRCETQFQTTGNDVIDGVLQRMQWTDIQYDFPDDKTFPGDGGANMGDSLARSKATLLSVIVGPVFDFVRPCHDWVSTKCLPSDTFLSRAHHLQNRTDPHRECFRIGQPHGTFDCKFEREGSGLEEEMIEVETLDRIGEDSDVLSWRVDHKRTLDPKKGYYTSQDFGSLIYTLHTRLVSRLFNDKKVSQAYVKPSPLKFYQVFIPRHLL